MKRKSWVGIIIALVVVAMALPALLSCARAGPTTPTAAKAPTTPAAKPIKIGGQSITSGPLGQYGREMKQGAVMAVDEINKEGGILGRPVKLKWADSELSPQTGVKNFRRLVTQWGADFLMGIDSSGVAMSVGPVLPKLDRVGVVCHAATNRLTEELVYEKGIKNIFRVSAPVYQDGTAVSIYTSKKFPKVKRIAGILPDYEYGHSAWALFKQAMKKRNPDVKFVYAGWVPFGTLDFSSYLSAAMAKKPDVIYTVEWGGEGISLIKQALSRGVFGKIDAWVQPMLGGGPDCRGIAWAAKKGKFGGKIVTTGRYIWNWPDTARNKKFVKRYVKRYDVPPVYSALNAYDAVHLFKRAAEKAGSIKTGDLIKAMEGMKLKSPAGTKYIRPADHQAVYNVPVGRLGWSKKYGIPKVTDLMVLPAKKYYRSPPFKPIMKK